MIRKNYNTFKEAKDAAESLFLAERGNPTEYELHTKERTITYKDGHTSPNCTIEDVDTGAMAYLYQYWDMGEYTLTFLTYEERKEDNRTYPFRDVTPDQELLMLIPLQISYLKPVKPVTIDELKTKEGRDALSRYYAYDLVFDFYPYEELKAVATVDTAFDGDCLLFAPLPEDVAQLTGVEIKTAKDYAKGIGILLKADLTQEQTDIVESYYDFNISYLFELYAYYEFARTENYAHLQEILAQYGKMGLPRPIQGLSDKDVEKEVLARYLNPRVASAIGAKVSVRDISKFTGAPMAKVSEANKIGFFRDF